LESEKRPYFQKKKRKEEKANNQRE